MRTLLAPILAISLILSACGGMTSDRRSKADLLVFNGSIYTVDSSFSIQSAMAVSDGKVLETGALTDLTSKYDFLDSLDLNGQVVYPGIIDAHAHFRNYAQTLMRVDLSETTSWEECLERVKAFAEEVPDGPILGRGWDQNDWENQEYPTRTELDELFPDRPVLLTRIDGHGGIANKIALDLAGLNPNSRIEGGEIFVSNGALTGVVLDVAKQKVNLAIPRESIEQYTRAVEKAQEDCFAVGLTGIVDAGLPKTDIDILDSLQKIGLLKMPLNIMVSISRDALDYYSEAGPYETDLLTVKSFKVYADGALGSRGAYLKDPYHDRADWYGFLITDSAALFEIAEAIAKTDFQMNTHAIGDGGNRIVLEAYAHALKGKNDRRWRIEHAQVVTPTDYELFADNSIVPSVQPTHATSDMYWAEDRLGEDRIKHAYAYQDLLNIHGWIPLGTDFPVEQIDPKLTFYSGVFRQDVHGFPEGGFNIENKLSREDVLRGMTLWAAQSCFWESSRGSLEKGKRADFIVLGTDWMQASKEEILSSKVEETYLAGERVY